MKKYRTLFLGGVFMLYLRTKYHTPASDWPLVITQRTDRSTKCFLFCYALQKSVALKREADHSPPFSTKNEERVYIYTSILPLSFITCTVTLPLK